MTSIRKIEFEISKKPGGRVPTAKGNIYFKDKKRYSRKVKHIKKIHKE